MIISISGLISSGKDTLADFLVNEHNFTKFSFASTVKDVLAVVFQWDRELLEGSTKESREWRQQVDTWWAQKLGIPGFTPRWAMQNIGTDLWRQHFNDNIWVYALEKRLEKVTGNVVISDARYPNELEMLSNLGATLVCVERGELPDWYKWAYKYNKTIDTEVRTRMRIIASLHDAEPNPYNKRIHTSEWKWIGTDFDITIDNNGSYEELRSAAKNLAQGHSASKLAHCA